MELGITYQSEDEVLLAFGARVTELEEIESGRAFGEYSRKFRSIRRYHVIGMPERDADGRLRVAVEPQPSEFGPADGWIYLDEYGLDPSQEDWDEEKWLVGSHICV